MLVAATRYALPMLRLRRYALRRHYAFILEAERDGGMLPLAAIFMLRLLMPPRCQRDMDERREEASSGEPPLRLMLPSATLDAGYAYADSYY